MKKLRPREGKWLARGHRAGKAAPPTVGTLPRWHRAHSPRLPEPGPLSAGSASRVCIASRLSGQVRGEIQASAALGTIPGEGRRQAPSGQCVCGLTTAGHPLPVGLPGRRQGSPCSHPDRPDGFLQRQMRATWKQLAQRVPAAKTPAPSTASPEQPPDESLYTVSPGPAPSPQAWPPPSGLAWVWLPSLVMLPRVTLSHAPAVTSLSLQFLICKPGQEVPPGGLPMKVN